MNLQWEELAERGDIKGAVEAYVRRYDWVTFAELRNRLKGYVEMAGDCCIEIVPNGVLWTGMSDAFCTAITELIKEEKLFFHLADALPYFIDGGALALPLAKRVTKTGYKKPHWLPVYLRVVPIEDSKAARKQATRKGRSTGGSHG